MRGSVRRLAYALLVWVILLAGASSARAASASPEEMCSGQQAAVQELQGEISAHNAKPHTFVVPEEEAAADAYDAEAAELNGRRATVEDALQQCLEAMRALEGVNADGRGLSTPTSLVESRIAEAKAKIPEGAEPPSAPTPGKGWQVTEPFRDLFRELRQGNPGDLGDIELQGVPRPNVKDPDGAFPSGSGRVIRARKGGDPAVSGDHIVSLAELMSMRGFLRLTPRNMYAVSRARLNLQWLSYAANLSKGSRSAAAVTGADAAWVEEQVALENRVRRQLQDIIDKLLKSQGDGE